MRAARGVQSRAELEREAAAPDEQAAGGGTALQGDQPRVRAMTWRLVSGEVIGGHLHVWRADGAYKTGPMRQRSNQEHSWTSKDADS